MFANVKQIHYLYVVVILLTKRYNHFMSENLSMSRSLANGAGWLGATAALSVAAAYGMANHMEREGTVGAHEAIIAPTLDGHTTLIVQDTGRGRIPSGSPFGLGAKITIPDSSLLRYNLEGDALIAQQPEAEVQNIKETVSEIWIEAGKIGLGIGSLTTGGLYLASRRRQSPDLETDSRTRLIGAGLAGASIAAIGIMALSNGNFNHQDEFTWTQVVDAVPELAAVDSQYLQELEVAGGFVSNTFIQGANSMIESYKASSEYYGRTYDNLDLIKDQLRVPQEGEVVLIQVTDRHNNIAMDRIARKIGDMSGATIVLSTGDDTSSGEPWEAFSLNSLNAAFKGYDRAIATGNHDNGFVGKYLTERGWVVLDGEVVTIQGVSIVGDADPESSSVTDRYSDGEESLEDVEARIAKAACDYGVVNLAATHRDKASAETVALGCTESTANGHQHKEAPPTNVLGANGQYVTTHTSTSSGGANFAWALGTKLKKEAQVTTYTYGPVKGSDKLRFLGLQTVTISTEGTPNASEFWPAVQLADNTSQAGRTTRKSVR